MKKIVGLKTELLIVFLITLLGVSYASAQKTPPEKINLVFASGWPKGHSFGAPGQEMYIDIVKELCEKRGEGRIDIRYAGGETLLSFAEMLDGCKTGIADIVGFAPSHVAGKAPLLSAVELPYIVVSQQQSERLWKKYYTTQPDVMAEMEKWDFKLLTFHPGYEPQGINLKKPANTLADIEGRRIRVLGGIGALIIEALGAKPVTIKSSETYTALSTGVVDGALFHLSSFYGWKWFEVCQYTIVQSPDVLHSTILTGMNSKKFARLPKWAQDILLDAGEEHLKRLAPIDAKQHQDTVDKMKKLGHNFIYFTKEQMVGWEKARDKAAEAWAQRAGAAGERVAEWMKREVSKLD